MELGTTDGEAAKKFYTELFGWSYNDSPVGPGMVYTMLKLEGKDVGALYQMPAEMTSQEYRQIGSRMFLSPVLTRAPARRRNSELQ